jgi:hypothetical protein
VSSTFAFPLPFDLDRIDSASLTFCITLVAQHDSALPCNVDGPGTGTISLTS